MLTDAQYALISPTTLVYPNQPDPLIIPDSTTAQANPNMRISHTEKVRIFREVIRVVQALVQQIVSTVEEAYLADISNHTTNSINDTVANFLTNLQYNYGQLMPHEILNCKDIVKKTIYNLQDPIATIFSVVEELLEGPLH